MLKPTLEKWDRLKRAQLELIDFALPKSAITEKLASICEENGWGIKHLTELELLHTIDNPNVGMWHAYQLLDPEDDAHTIELVKFKEQFKAHLTELVQNVSMALSKFLHLNVCPIKIKKHTDEAIWIRLAWGESFSRIFNNYAPLQLCMRSLIPAFTVTKYTLFHSLFFAALGHQTQPIKNDELSGPSHASESAHRRIQQMELSSNRRQLACEAFGGGKLPEIQSAVYRLETKFRGHNPNMAQRKEPFKCVVKFSSANLLESLRYCASSGVASTPVTPLFSSIPLKGRNYFVIKDTERKLGKKNKPVKHRPNIQSAKAIWVT
ncbi:hypothetical protein WMY93_014476 [Mugilogobius chulae]|uniref:Uncharacterized protein n=1 Tax=Mugilogobius chulae TaxID=88201 RepID=A0AAW0P6D9_9GOBI